MDIIKRLQIMLNKVCLIIKNSTNKILVNKCLKNTIWSFPYFYKKKPNTKLINSILELTNRYNIESIKTINYLFETTQKTIDTDMIIMSYYELLTQEEYSTKIYNNFFTFVRYVPKDKLKILPHISPIINTYLNLNKIQ